MFIIIAYESKLIKDTTLLPKSQEDAAVVAVDLHQNDDVSDRDEDTWNNAFHGKEKDSWSFVFRHKVAFQGHVIVAKCSKILEERAEKKVSLSHGAKRTIICIVFS